MELRSDKDLIVRACGCGSMACPHCRTALAMRLRDRLKGVIDRFSDIVYFVTLTTGRDKSAYDYYKEISENRGVGEFVRSIGSTCYVSVPECHDDGYLHWHLVVNVKNRLDFKFLHSSGKLKHAWRWGRVDFSAVKYDNRLRTLCYITKYITFTADEQKTNKKHAFADWILNLSHFRFFSASRGLFGLSHRKKDYDRIDEDDKLETVKEYRKAKTLAERMKKCCTKINFFTRLGEFVRSVAISFEDFLKLKPLYNKRFVQREGWSSAKECYYVSSDALDWLSGAIDRLKNSGYLSGGKLVFPFKIPLFGDDDWLRLQEDRLANDWSYHRDFFGRYSFGGSHV